MKQLSLHQMVAAVAVSCLASEAPTLLSGSSEITQFRKTLWSCLEPVLSAQRKPIADVHLQPAVVYSLLPFLSRSHQLPRALLALGLVLNSSLTPLGGVSFMATWRFHHVFINVFGLPKNISVFAATSVSRQDFKCSPWFIFPLSSYISVFPPGDIFQN